MPYKSGTLKGQLTTAEIRKLVQAHNKLSKITIPPKSSRDEILTIISKAGFRVNHEKQLLEQLKNMDISVEKAKVVTKPVKKTEEQKKEVVSKSDTKKQPKKLKKDLKQDIEYGIELEQTDTPLDKNRCKDWIYVSKKMIQADKDNFKKVRFFDKDVSNDVDSFGRRFKTPTPLLKIYDFISMFESKNTADRIRKLCGVQEATFAETAYDIIYNKWDKVKDAIVKQNIKKNPDIASKLKKPKQIEYQYYEPKKEVKKDVSKDDTEEEKNLEGWKKYFMIVEENKELLKNHKIAPPFRDSYSFYKTNADVREGQSNMNNKWTKWIEILEKRIKEIKEKKPDEKEEKKDEGKEKEVRDLWKKILFPELRTEKDPKKLKKLFNKAVDIYADYKVNVLKTGVSKQTEAKRIKKVGGGSNLISKFIKGDKVNKVSIMGVDITDLYALGN